MAWTRVSELGMRRRMHARKQAPSACVLRVRAARRRTHKYFSAVSASKAPAGIAVIWLSQSFLRARDEARRASEAPRRRRAYVCASEAEARRECGRIDASGALMAVRARASWSVAPVPSSLARSMLRCWLRVCVRARRC